MQFLGKSCNAKHALLRHFICTLHQVNLFHKTFSVLLHVFQTFNRLGDRFLSCCEIFLPTYWSVFSSKSDTSEQSNNNQMVPDALGSRTPALGVKLLSITVMTRCEKQFLGCWQDIKHWEPFFWPQGPASVLMSVCLMDSGRYIILLCCHSCKKLKKSVLTKDTPVAINVSTEFIWIFYNTLIAADNCIQ